MWLKNARVEDDHHVCDTVILVSGLSLLIKKSTRFLWLASLVFFLFGQLAKRHQLCERMVTTKWMRMKTNPSPNKTRLLVGCLRGFDFYTALIGQHPTISFLIIDKFWSTRCIFVHSHKKNKHFPCWISSAQQSSRSNTSAGRCQSSFATAMRLCGGPWSENRW